MADSLLNIGGESEFPLDIDWGSAPSHEFVITRYLIEKKGTITTIEQKNDETPIRTEAKFYIGDKEEEYDFLDFIHTCLGRVNRFWIKYPKQAFVLNAAVSNGALSMKVKPNDFDLFYVGHERIFILMDNGDLITRQVTNATYSEANDEITLEFDDAIDRDIGLTDYVLIGRYLLVRFDSDDFDLTYLTDLKAEVSLKFHELISDYADLAED